MEEQLLLYNDSQNCDNLRNYVESLDSSIISSELPKILWRNDGAAVVQVLLNGLSSSLRCYEKKFKVAEDILHEIEKNQLPARISEKLVYVLAGEVDSFTNQQLFRLVEVCCDMIRSPNADSKFSCWKDLLPKLLHLLITKSVVEHEGSQITGDEYKSSLITSLCLMDWRPNVIVDLATMFIDMPMNKEERGRVVRKFCKLLPNLPPDKMPDLAGNLLVLSKSEFSMTFILALSSFFNINLYEKIDSTVSSQNSSVPNLKEVSMVEANVLYHIANKHGPSVLKDMMKTLRVCTNAPQFPLQPFHVTLLLALSATSQACEDDVMSLLKTSFSRAGLEAERISDSTWLRSICPSSLDVNKLLFRILENWGRDTVLKGLMSLGFTLLAAGKGGDGLHALGTSILEDMVKRNKLVASIVLETLENYIYQASECSQYTDCLLVLARKQALCLLECTPQLLHLLQSCSLLPPRTGLHVLMALLPLARLSHNIRDNLVIILRKSLFPHDVERRILGVHGFLELLRDLKISNLQTLSQSMSQNYCNFTQLCSQSLAGGASLSNEGLCLEVLALLREVFKQQSQVKTVFYKGIYSSVRANPELGPHALDYLQTHMHKWYDDGDVIPPMKFHDAVTIQGSDVVLQEPLGDMVLCLALLVAKLDDVSRRIKLQEMLYSLCQRMSTITLSHLGMEDGTILEHNLESLKSQEVLRQILGVYEALMGYLLCAWHKDDNDNSQLFWNLFKGYTCLCEYAKSLGKDKKKGEKRSKSDKSKPPIFKFPTTVLNFKCCSRLLAIINNVGVSWAPEHTTVHLRGKRELHRYAVRVAQQVVKDARAEPPAQVARDCHSLGYLCNIGRTLYSNYVSKLAEMKAFDLPSAMTALQAFADLIALILSHFKSKFVNFLKEIGGGSNISQNHSNSLEKIIDALVEQLPDVLAEDQQEDESKEDQQAKKMSVLYVAIITSLVQQLPATAPYSLQLFEKLKDVCMTRKLEKPQEAKAFLTLVLTINRRSKNSASLLLDLACSLCRNMQLINEEMEIEDHAEYAVVNPRTANVCLVAVCDALQAHLADIDWTVNRFKAEVVTLTFPGEESVTDRKAELLQREMELCRQMNCCVRALSGLCSIAVPPGVYSDAVLKTLELSYNRLTALTKYFLTKVTKFQDNLLDSKFDKTVRIVDSELTKNMYCFTEHVIADGTSDARGVKPSLLKQRALKETKHIPKVVLEKEQFHKFLLQLSKRAKIDLASKTKHAMARDYRLYTKEVKRLLDSERNEQEDEDMDIIEDTENNTAVQEESPSQSPVQKRRRSGVIENSSPISSQASTP